MYAMSRLLSPTASASSRSSSSSLSASSRASSSSSSSSRSSPTMRYGDAQRSLRQAAVAAATAAAGAGAGDATATNARTRRRRQSSPSSSPALPALASYTRHERVFAPLPPHDRRVRRREQVRHFVAAHTRWNSSVRDEQHPFPQRALTHTTACYCGVDVLDTHFPATVAHTSLLRHRPLPPQHGQQQQQQQKGNSSKHSSDCNNTYVQPSRLPSQPAALPYSERVAHRYRYTCAALDDPPVPLSFLARVLVEDSAPGKQARRRGWCASTSLDGPRGNKHVAAPREPDYVALNKHTREEHDQHTQKDAATAMSDYCPPWERVRRSNTALRHARELRAAAAIVTPLTLYTRDDVPATLTMRNRHRWMHLDPVQVAQEQQRRAAELRSNPYVTGV